jgi:hypothetical protein
MKRVPRREIIRYIVRHPCGVTLLVRAGWRLRGRGWWHHRPFLPVPPADYWTFRVTTAMGDSDASMGVDDIVQAARWTVRQRVGR